VVTIINAAIKGRARFKVEGLYRSETLKVYLECSLTRTKGIEQVHISVLTGNILVFFNSNNSPHSIALQIERVAVEFHKNSNAQAVAALITKKTDKSGSDTEKALQVKKEKTQYPVVVQVQAHKGLVRGT